MNTDRANEEDRRKLWEKIAPWVATKEPISLDKVKALAKEIFGKEE